MLKVLATLKNQILLRLSPFQIHGGKSQNQRSRALADFTNGRVQALIATDVAARGIHVDGVASVIHYDPPEDHKAYIHRSGRTARAGQSGVVLSFVAPDQKKKARRLQQRIDIDQPITEPDIEILKTLSPVNTSGKKFQAPYKEKSETKNSSHKRNSGQKKQGSNKRKSSNSSNKHRGGNKHKSNNKARNNKHRPSDSNNQSNRPKNKSHTSSSKKNNQSKNSKGPNRSSNKNQNNKNHQNRKQNQKTYASR